MACKLKKAREWESVLSVASLYGFDSVFRVAVHHLATVGEADKVVIGRRFSIRSLVVAGYVDIINRANSLKASEIRLLDSQDVANITHQREKYQSRHMKDKGAQVTEANVEKLFGASLPQAPQTNPPQIPPVNVASTA